MYNVISWHCWTYNIIITCEKAFFDSPVAMTDSSPGKTLPLYALGLASNNTKNAIWVKHRLS